MVLRGCFRSLTVSDRSRNALQSMARHPTFVFVRDKLYLFLHSSLTQKANEINCLCPLSSLSVQTLVMMRRLPRLRVPQLTRMRPLLPRRICTKYTAVSCEATA